MKKASIYFLLFFTLVFNSCEESSDNQIYYQDFELKTEFLISDTMSYDINNDQINDIGLYKRFWETQNPEPNQSIYNFVLDLKRLDSKIEFGYLISTEYTDLVIGDVVDSDSRFEWLEDFKAASFSRIPFLDSWNEGTPGFFNEKYLAIKITNGNNHNFGWIKLKQFQIEEIAYNLTSNTPIEIGQKD